MSPFMTVEVLMTESAHRDARKHRSSDDHRGLSTKGDRSRRAPSRPRRSLRTLFRTPTWTSQSV